MLGVCTAVFDFTWPAPRPNKAKITVCLFVESPRSGLLAFQDFFFFFSFYKLYVGGFSNISYYLFVVTIFSLDKIIR